MNKMFNNYISLIIAMFCWGSVYPVSKYLMSDIPPDTLAFLRYFTAVIFLTPFFLLEKRKKENSYTKKIFINLLLSSLSGTTIFAILLFKGVSLSTATYGSIIINSQPIFTAIISYFILKNTIHRKQVLGIILGFTGLYIVVTGGLSFSAFDEKNILMGNLILLLGSISMSFYGIFISKPVKEIGGITATWLSMSFGTILLFFFNLFFKNSFLTELFFHIENNFFLILYLGSVATAASYLLFTISLKKIDVVSATGFKFLIPVSGVTLSVFILGETPSIFTYIGILIVIASVFLIQKNTDLYKITRRSY